MINAYLDGLRGYFTFSGRTSRRGYWLYIASLAVLLFAALLIETIFGLASNDTRPLVGFVSLTHLIPNLAITARRLHDQDRSAWWLLLLLTGIGGIVIFVFTLLPGTPNDNRFGEGDYDYDDEYAEVAPGSPQAGHSSRPVTPRAAAPMNYRFRWWHGAAGVAALLVIYIAFSGSSDPCSGSVTKTSLDRTFTSKLAAISAKLNSDFATHGQRGNAVVCSVSFNVPPEAFRRFESLPTPRNGEQAEAYALTLELLPSVMVHAQQYPTAPFTARVRYEITPKSDGGNLLRVLGLAPND